MGNLAIYATKGFEYLLILGFLALFTLFYLYFTSNRFEKVTAVISSTIDQLVDWFGSRTIFCFTRDTHGSVLKSRNRNCEGGHG